MRDDISVGQTENNAQSPYDHILTFNWQVQPFKLNVTPSIFLPPDNSRPEVQEDNKSRG